MKIVSFDRVQYALGLEWSILPSDKKEMRKQLEMVKKHRPRSKAYLLKGAELGVAYTEKDVPSAAALLCWLSNDASKKSGKPETWVVIEKIGQEAGEDYYWLCVASEGVVVPGMDAVGNYEKISETLAEVVDLLDGATVYTTDSNFEAYVSELVEVNSTSFVDLIKLAPKQAIKACKPAAYAYEKQLAIYLLTILVLAASAAGGYKWWIKYQMEQAKKAGKLQGPTTAEIRKKAEEAAAAKTVENFNLFLQSEANKQQVSLSDAYPVWLEAVESMPVNVAGWSANEVNCTVVPAECQVKWMRGKLATAKGFLDAMPKADIDKNTYSNAITTFNITYPAKKETKLHFGPNKDQYELTLVSNLQSLLIKPFNHQVKPLTSLKYDAVVIQDNSNNNATANVQKNVGVAYTEIELTGNKLWTSKAALEEFNTPWMYADSFNLKFKPGETGQWAIKTKLWLSESNSNNK